LPNKVYVLNAEGQMGAFVAGVNFKQLNPNEKSSKNLFARKLKNSNAVFMTLIIQKLKIRLKT
jgi:hypothetical protein